MKALNQDRWPTVNLTANYFVTLSNTHPMERFVSKAVELYLQLIPSGVRNVIEYFKEKHRFLSHSTLPPSAHPESTEAKVTPSDTLSSALSPPVPISSSITSPSYSISPIPRSFVPPSSRCVESLQLPYDLISPHYTTASFTSVGSLPYSVKVNQASIVFW